MNNLLGQRVLIYEGSAKLIYAGIDDNTLILHFIKKDHNDIWRNKVSESIWKYLNGIGLENHFLRTLNIREQLITAANVFPIFIRMHNIVHNDLSIRLGIEQGTLFTEPLIEWHLKSKYLGDPLISRDHIEFFQWLTKDQIKTIRKIALRTNDILRSLFYCMNLKPSTIELCFGGKDGRIILTGELSPETITFWDDATYKFIEKDEVYEKMKSMPFQQFSSL